MRLSWQPINICSNSYANNGALKPLSWVGKGWCPTNGWVLHRRHFLEKWLNFGFRIRWCSSLLRFQKGIPRLPCQDLLVAAIIPGVALGSGEGFVPACRMRLVHAWKQLWLVWKSLWKNMQKLESSSLPIVIIKWEFDIQLPPSKSVVDFFVEVVGQVN